MFSSCFSIFHASPMFPNNYSNLPDMISFHMRMWGGLICLRASKMLGKHGSGRFNRKRRAKIITHVLLKKTKI